MKKNLLKTMVLPTDLGKTQSVYRVTLDPAEIYCLGPFTRVLSAVSEDTFVIAVETSNKEEVLRTIHRKGQNLYQADLQMCLRNGRKEMVDFYKAVKSSFSGLMCRRA